jgi:hypothetical protein
VSYSVKMNGRTYFVDSRVCEITEVSAGRFSVEYDRTSFEVLGGRKSGGAAHEWFVRNELFFGDRWLPCNSMIEAVRKGIQY